MGGDEVLDHIAVLDGAAFVVVVCDEVVADHTADHVVVAGVGNLVPAGVVADAVDFGCCQAWLPC